MIPVPAAGTLAGIEGIESARAIEGVTGIEISVPTSPITAKIQLTSTAIKDGTTSIQSIVEYRPYEDDIVDRVRINSWRVCDGLC